MPKISPFNETPSGIQRIPRERDWLWLEFIHRHGDLSWPFLHELTKERWKSHFDAQKRVKLLRKDLQLLEIGDPDMRRYRLLNVPIFYALTAKAIKELKGRGKWHLNFPRSKSMWRHNTCIATITASIEIGVLQTPYRFIPHHEIVDYIDCSSFNINGVTVTPDRLFGIDYGDQVVLCILEFDRGTEMLGISESQRKTIRGQIDLYSTFFHSQQYKDVFRIKKKGTSVMVLTAFTEKSRMDFALKHSKAKYQGFIHYPYLGASSTYPVPRPELIIAEWQRTGHEPFRLV